MIDHEGEVPNCIDVFISETHSIKIAASIHIKLHQSYLELTPFSLKPYLNYPFSRTLYINIPEIYTMPPYYQWNQEASPVCCHDFPLTWLLNDAFNGFHLHISTARQSKFPESASIPSPHVPLLQISGEEQEVLGLVERVARETAPFTLDWVGRGGKGSGLKNGGDRETQNFGEGGSVEREWFQQEKAIQVWRTKDDRIRPIEKGNSIN